MGVCTQTLLVTYLWGIKVGTTQQQLPDVCLVQQGKLWSGQEERCEVQGSKG